jgi:hypothetical protein
MKGKGKEKGREGTGKEQSQEGCTFHLEGGMLHAACVKGICHKFIKIYDSRSYIEGVKGLRAQSIYCISSLMKGKNNLEDVQISTFYTS